MSVMKKILIGVLVTSIVAAGTAGGLSYLKKANAKEIMVVSVSSLADDYYMPSTTLDGTITSNVSQKISFDSDMIIENVYVQKGDSVKKGDLLMTFDMTLVEMELNIAQLKHQQLEQDLSTAQKRLTSLQNGGAVEESDSNPVDADNLSNTSSDMASAGNMISGNYLAASLPVLYLAAAVENMEDIGTEELLEGEPEDELSSGSSLTQQQTPIYNGDVSYNEPVTDDLFSGEEEDEITPTPTPDVWDPSELTGLTDGDAPFYAVLDYDTEPYAGSGTEEDPYVFLCSSAKGKVTVMGSFFNRMAGYNEDGTQVVKEGGSWFLLEFHQNDTISDFQERKTSCTGYYFVDGSLLAEPVNMFAEVELTLEDAAQYEEEELPTDDDTWDYSGDVSSSTTTLTRAEAIKIQQTKIASLNLDIQESELNISKLEKKVENKEIYSQLDGTVAYVGDATTGTSTGSAFLQIKSEEGYYVQGSVSELLLDEVQEGTVLNCTSYEFGSFEAEVYEVSDYPSSDDSYWNDGNPNVSYYTFYAEITDQSLSLSDQSWVSITLNDSTSSENRIVLSKAFVRTENGSSYVYKDEDGVLVKQFVSVGGSVNSGYSVLITGGLSKDDKIAFPYGKNAQEGVKTKDSTLDEFYGY
jgi:hypothetical protein